METFKAHTKAGSQAETASFYAVHSVMARSFSGEFEEIERKTQEAENISTFVQQMAVKVGTANQTRTGSCRTDAKG